MIKNNFLCFEDSVGEFGDAVKAGFELVSLTTMRQTLPPLASYM